MWPGEASAMRVVGVGTAHVTSRTRSFPPFSTVQSAHARPRGEDSAVGQSHLERQGRRQRHSNQRLRRQDRRAGFSEVVRRPTTAAGRRIRKHCRVDCEHAQWVVGDSERAALHHQEDQGRSGKRGGDKRLEVCGDGGRSSVLLDLLTVPGRSDDRHLHSSESSQGQMRPPSHQLHCNSHKFANIKRCSKVAMRGLPVSEEYRGIKSGGIIRVYLRLSKYCGTYPLEVWYFLTQCTIYREKFNSWWRHKIPRYTDITVFLWRFSLIPRIPIWKTAAVEAPNWLLYASFVQGCELKRLSFFHSFYAHARLQLPREIAFLNQCWAVADCRDASIDSVVERCN